MKRKGCYRLCIIVGLLLLVPFTPFSQSSSWNEYDGELFAITYPGDWSIIGGEGAMAFFRMDQEEGEQFDGAIFTEEEFDPENTNPEVLYQTGFITIMMATLDEDERGDDYYEELFGDITPGLTDPYKDVVEIGGYDGHTLTGMLKEPPLSVYVAVTVVEEFGFVFMGMMPQERMEEMIDMVEEMIDSVSFPD